MPKNSSIVNGFYLSEGKLQLENGMTLNWNQLNNAALPAIPYGTGLEVTLAYDEVDYLNGSTGVVWATYHLRQAETIKAALLAQSIGCEMREHSLPGARLYVLCIPQATEVAAAVDFIWRDSSGLAPPARLAVSGGRGEPELQQMDQWYLENNVNPKLLPTFPSPDCNCHVSLAH